MGKSEVKGPNPDQLKAINIDKGAALVVAGAGTGKTRVIVERIIRLIDVGVDPHGIVALTFTEKAANEMLDRINTQRGGYNFDLTVMTFNAFGEQILRRYATDIGLNSGLKLMGEAAQIVFLREHLDELKLDYYSPVTNPTKNLEELARYFSRLKQSVVRPDKYLSYAHNLPKADDAQKQEKIRHLELAGAYEAYINLARKFNVIDYDDQLFLTLELFDRRPNVLKKIQDEIEYLLVDEFQDTNPMQSDLLDSLVKPHNNIMVVGDDDQSIYGWRGATLENIMQFKERYPHAKEIVLTSNYRSTQAILDASYKLIRHNDPYRLEARHGFDKRLTSRRQGTKPILKSFHTLNDELTFVVKDIERRLKAGEDPGGIAVLARSNTLVSRLHDLFDAYGIEHSVAGISHDLYRQPIVTDIINVLKAIADPTDNSSVYHALLGIVFAIEPKELSPLSFQARKQHENLLELLETGSDSKLKEAALLLRQWHDVSATAPVSQVLYKIYEERLKPWLFAQLSNEDGEAQAQQAGGDLNEFFNTLKDFERIAQRITTSAYVQNLEALVAAGEDVADDTVELADHNINIMTVHKAKGLEWSTVYVVDLTMGGFPMKKFAAGLELPVELSRTSSPADEHILEERRLMYVAMTRAADELVLTYSHRRSPSGNRRLPSIFLDEALGENETEPTQIVPASDVLLASSSSKTLPAASLPGNMVDGENLVLTASQIETYLNCPRDFYYKYVLNWPEEPSASALTGQLIHDVIADINRASLNGSPPSNNQVEQMLAERWPRSGFSSLKQRERSLTAAKTILDNFMKRSLKDKHWPELVEQTFNIYIPDGKVRIFGRFDAVYTDEDVEIRDYKTGLVKSQEQADEKAKNSQQLSVYALAWQQMDTRPPASLTLDFIGSGLIGHSSRSQRRIDNTRQKIATIADKIRDGQYPLGYRHDYCLHPPVD